MSKKRVPHLDAPFVGSNEKRYLSMALESGFISSVGPYLPEFEISLAGYLGVPSSVAVQSGTAALYMSLYELGIGQGDEVIVPALTFVATVNPVCYLGATPVFVDVEIGTWNIDPLQLKKYITKRTRAIIPVHLYGNPCKMDTILDQARINDLFVVEDATESLGAVYQGKKTGTLGNFGCFSFNGNKTITTGGGGLVVSRSQAKLRHIRFLINQAKDPVQPGNHPEIGFNYRMTNIEAALGLAQMERLEGFLKKKRLFNEIYRHELSSLRSIVFQEPYPQAVSSCWLSSILLEEGSEVGKFQAALIKKQVPTRRLFMPIPRLPPYRGFSRGSFPNADMLYKRGLCLPSSTRNTPEDIYYVCKQIKQLL